MRRPARGPRNGCCKDLRVLGHDRHMKERLANIQHSVAIRVARAIRGASAANLARQIGISSFRLSRLERGHAMPRSDELLAIEGALAVSLDELNELLSQAGSNQKRLRLPSEKMKAGCRAPHAAPASRNLTSHPTRT